MMPLILGCIFWGVPTARGTVDLGVWYVQEYQLTTHSIVPYKLIGASPGRDYEDGIISTYYILWSRQYIISKKGGNAPRATD